MEVMTPLYILPGMINNEGENNTLSDTIKIFVLILLLKWYNTRRLCNLSATVKCCESNPDLTQEGALKSGTEIRIVRNF